MKLPILKSSDVQKPSKGQGVLYINEDDKKLYSLDYNGNILKFEKDFPIDIKNVTISNNNVVLKGNFFIGKNDAGEFELFEGNVENHGNVEISLSNSEQTLNPGYYESIIIPAKPEESLPEIFNGPYTITENGTLNTKDKMLDNNIVINVPETDMSNITPENIKADIYIPAIGTRGTFTADATATAADILKGKTAGINGQMIVGTYEPSTSSDNQIEIPTGKRAFSIAGADGEFADINGVYIEETYTTSGSIWKHSTNNITFEEKGWEIGEEYEQWYYEINRGDDKHFINYYIEEGGQRIDYPFTGFETQPNWNNSLFKWDIHVNRGNEMTGGDILGELEYKLTFSEVSNSSGDTSNNPSSEGTLNNPYSLLCVTSYKEGYDKISSFEMSDFPPDDPDMGMWEDLTPLNGTYTVTNETEENGEFERVYKHTHGSDIYYFHYIKESMNYGSYGWAISKNTIATDAWGAICLNWRMPHIIEGNGAWSGEMNMVYASGTISNISKTYIDNEIVCKYITGYDEESLSYSFSEETTTLSQYEVEPIEHYCYLSDGTKLIGNSVGNEGGQHLLSYVRGNESNIVETIRSPRDFTRKHQLLKAWKYPSYQFPFNYDTPRISSEIVIGKSCIGTWSDCPELTIYDDAGLYKYESRGRMEPLPFDFDDEFTVSMFFDGIQKGVKRRLFYIYFNETYNIKVDLDFSSFNVLLTNNDEKIISHTASGYEMGWFHIALTNNVKDKKIILYLNGMQKGEYNYEFMVKNGFRECTFSLGKDDGSYRLGHYREIKLFDVALTPSQVNADYNKGLKAL
jgi:hypothetical protein